MNRRSFILKAGVLVSTAAILRPQAATIIIPSNLARNNGGGSACATTQDSNSGASNGQTAFGNTSSKKWIATKFVAGASYTLCSFSAYLRCTGSPTQTITPYVFDNGADIPGTQLGAGSVFNCNVLTGTETQYTMTGLSVALTSGNTYWLVFQISAIDVSNFPQWDRNSSLAAGTNQVMRSSTDSPFAWTSETTTRRNKFVTFS